MAPEKADKVLVVVDIRDPLTYDREFVRAVKYSPFVLEMDEISERKRQEILRRDQGPEQEIDDVLIHKFVIEVDPPFLGDFALQFLPNEKSQRALVFAASSVEPLPTNGEMGQIMKKVKTGLPLEEVLEDFPPGLLQVFELKTCGELSESGYEEDYGHEDGNEDDSEGYEEDSDSEYESGDRTDARYSVIKQSPSLPSFLIADVDVDVDADQDQDQEDGYGLDGGGDQDDDVSEDDIEDRMEDIALSGSAFVISAPKLRQ